MKRIIAMSLFAAIVAYSATAQTRRRVKDCAWTFGGGMVSTTISLWGDVYVVTDPEEEADLKVYVATTMKEIADLWIHITDKPRGCGEWKFVKSRKEAWFSVRFVKSDEDAHFSIRFVTKDWG